MKILASLIATVMLTGCFATTQHAAGTLGGGALGGVVGNHIGGTPGMIIGGAAGAYVGSEITKPKQPPVIINRHYHQHNKHYHKHNNR